MISSGRTKTKEGFKVLPRKVQPEALKDTVRQALELCCASDYFLAKAGA
jgi:hypothetical protein